MPTRAICPRCRRPTSVCYCDEIVPLETRTRVVILQHPRERDVGIGTARMARLCLPGAMLRTSVDFSTDPVVRDLLGDSNAYVLFPGPGAINVETTVFPTPITLVVVDGTWWQAEKLLKANPGLARLPRLQFTPGQPSLYGQVRHEPAEHCVATIEAIAHVLGHLEGNPDLFRNMLRPFSTMVERQLHFATQVAAGRYHKRTKERRPRDTVPAILRTRQRDLVCVHGEANAWPREHPERHPPETVHWLARRLSSGESFEAVIAPRNPLAPSTLRHTRLAPDLLVAGETWAAFQVRFAAFLRPEDVLVTWGHFPLATLAADGLHLGHEHLDARLAVGRVLGHRIGTLEDCLLRKEFAPVPLWGAGRGGMRAANLCSVTQALCAWPLPD